MAFLMHPGLWSAQSFAQRFNFFPAPAVVVGQGTVVIIGRVPSVGPYPIGSRIPVLFALPFPAMSFRLLSSL